jgi:hypothetical protein
MNDRQQTLMDVKLSPSRQRNNIRKIRMPENSVPRRIFGRERDDVTRSGENCIMRNLITHHHRIVIKDLGHLLTRSVLTHSEVSSMVILGFFCLLCVVFINLGNLLRGIRFTTGSNA